MARDEVLRFRCSGAEKKRIEGFCKSIGVETGRWLRELALRESALKAVVIATPEPLDAQGVTLQSGLTLGKSKFRPDPKPK
jgi:hypothetical protein